MEYKQETENSQQSQRRREVPWWTFSLPSTNPSAHSGKDLSITTLFLTLFTTISSHMSGMGSHPLSSPMSSYYSAGMSAGMPGLSPNFGMPVSMSSMYSAGSSSMGMTAMSMSGVGSVGGMTSQGLAAATSYPSSASPYPGALEYNILTSHTFHSWFCLFQEVLLLCPLLCSTLCWTELYSCNERERGHILWNTSALQCLEVTCKKYKWI